MLIGDLLIKLYGLKIEDIDRALEIQKQVGGAIGQLLIQIGLINETQLIHALSGQLKLPVYNHENGLPDVEGLRSYLEGKIAIDFVVKNKFVPVRIDPKDRKVTFITNDPLNNSLLDYLVKSMDYDLQIQLAPEEVIKDISKAYSADSVGETVSLYIKETPERLKEMAFEAPVIKYLNGLISRAVELRASDIHIQPYGTKYKIRFRVDGVLHDTDSIPEEFYLALVSRVKLLSSLNIAEKRLPQDGKLSTRVSSTILDIRISTLPTVGGEDVVMRLLYRERLHFDLRSLGQKEDHYRMAGDMLSKPYGMILVTGPTGSGKTTTLYSMLTSLNNNEKKIVTIEDPVEYQIEGLNQVQVKTDIELTFAHALRSILRHDPDIIMVGEIRDVETARISIRSALTGHLVFSTLHTNDAPSSLFRFLEMGIDDYLINASVIGMMAQRVVRTNCSFCIQPDPLPPQVLTQYRIPELYEKFRDVVGSDIQFKRGKGCHRCVGTGYRGRTAIFEVLEYDEGLKEIFLKQRSLEAIRASLQSRPDFRTLREDGILKVINGLTTLEEVLRVT